LIERKVRVRGILRGPAAAFQDFAEAIRQGRRPLIDGLEGRRSVQVVEAIYQSARSSGFVTLR